MNVASHLRAYHSNPPFFERGNLAFRVWGITAGALLIIGSYLAWTSYDEYGKTLEQEYRSLETHARFGDSQVAGSLRSIDLLLQDVIDDRLSTPDLPANIVQRRQLDKLRLLSEIHYLITTDNKGQVVTAESLDDPIGVAAVRQFDASQRDYFIVHRDSKPDDYYRYQLSRPFKTITNRNTITLSRAIRGKNGQFQGVALVSLSPAYFESVLQQVLANGGADAAAVHNRFGDIIYRLPDPEMYIGKNIAGGPAFKAYLGSNQQLTRYLGVTATDGVKRILVFGRVGDTNLDVGVSAQFDVVMAGWHSNLLMKGLILVMVSGLSIALAFGGQRRLSERRRSEEALRESEERWKFAIEGSGDGVWDWNLQTDHVAYSSRWKEMLGYSDVDILPTNHEWVSRIHPEDQAYVAGAMQAYLEGKTEIYVVEYRLRCKDESYKWILGRGMVVSRSEDGKPLRMIGTHTDITERKQAEDALRESESRFFLFMENLPACAYIKDAQGRHIFVNEALARQTMTTAGSLLGKTNGDLWPKEIAAKLDSADAAVITGRSPLTIEEDVLIGNEARTYLTTKFPIERSNGGILLAGISFDITARKQAEAELIQHRDHLEELVSARTFELAHAKDAAEAANRAKTIFLATMSHEMRTPMNGVMGMVDLALRRATDPKQIDWLKKSQGSAKHLLDVIGDILDISHLEAEKMTLEEKNFSLAQVFEEVLQMEGEAAQAKGLRLFPEISPALPDMLCGDPTRLRQILINFVGNAIKFSDQGQITVNARAVEEDRRGVLLRIEVTDQGIGISPEQQTRLFHAFTQADGTMNRKYGGTGLGLSIAKRIALLMGGDAGVISEEGQGCTFWVTVRLKKGSDVVEAPPTVSVDAEAVIKQRYGGQRILVVDDEPINREVALIQLEFVDLVADTAEDGAEAVAMARKNSYAAIFMDMQMPKLNGVEATQEIRQLPGYRDIPIIAMTANAFAEDKAKCLAAGMSDFLVKPFNSDQLFSILLRALDQHEG